MTIDSTDSRPPDKRRKKKKVRREVDKAPRSERGDLLDPTPLLLAAIQKGLDAGYAEIDDRDIPRARNVIEWLINPEFLNIKPFAKQIQDAIHVFSAACFFCSDTEYLVDIPVDEKIPNILDRSTLMENGRCPKCGRRVLEMRHEWCLDPVNTFDGYIKEDPPNDICCLEGQRCLVGGTLVLTRSGLVPIKKVRPGDWVWAPDGWKLVWKHYRFKNKPTRRLTFDDGSTLRGGLQHRVKVMTSKGELVFRRFSELQKGDWVAHFQGTEAHEGVNELPAASYVPGPQSGNLREADIPTRMSPQLARLLGHLVAEGTVTSKYTVKFTNTDEQMHEDYISACVEVFGIEPQRHPPGFKDSEFCSRFVRHWLEQIGLTRSRAEKKRIPWAVLQCSPEYQWHFLSALFEGDGSASGNRLRYHTTSKRLAHQLLVLLRSLGFDPSLTVGATRPGSNSGDSFKPRPMYEVRIAKVQDIERFCRCVPWITDRKGSEAQALGVCHEQGRPLHLYPHCRPLVEGLHLEATRRVPVKIKTKSGKKSRHPKIVHRCTAPEKVRAVLRGQVKGQDQFLSSVGLETLADHFGSDQLAPALQEILAHDLRFKQITNVENCEDTDLHDLTVDGHVYWTQGVLSHNSGKSTKTAMYATWVLHRYLRLANPTKYFGLLESVGALHGTFVSVTAKQAWENLWQPFSDLIDSAPWFKQYHKWLIDKGQEIGMDLFHKPDTYLWYGHKRLALSFAPADQRTLRGRTRFLSCVAPDTLVPTSKGLIPIGSTCPLLGSSPGSFRTVTHRGCIRDVQAVIRNEARPTLVVETENGYRLTGTPDHKVLVLLPSARRQWRRLDDLRPNDLLVLASKGLWSSKRAKWKWIPSPRTSNRQKRLASIPTRMDDHLALFLGYHISEGSNAVGTNGNYRVKFSNGDKQVADEYETAFASCFGGSPTRTWVPKEKIAKATQDAFVLDYYSKDLIEYLEFVGGGGNSETKQIPWVILQSPRRYVVLFLQALFEGDGHVDSAMIRYDSKSEVLARQMQIVLSNFGIMSTVRPSYRPEYDQNYWVVGIYGEDRNTFIEQIGFRSDTKSSSGTKPVTTWHEPSVEPDLTRLRDAYVKGPNKFMTLDGSYVELPARKGTSYKGKYYKSLSSYLVPLQRMSLGTVRKLERQGTLRIIAQIDPDLARRLKFIANIRATPVVSVTEGPCIPTCDWTVEKDHSFPTNAIISHNCVDELGWFGASKDRSGTSRVRADGDGTVRALDRSLATIRTASRKRRKRRQNCPDGYQFTISSPSAATDPMMRRFKKASRSPRMYSILRATWDSNPMFTEQGLREQEGDVSERDFLCDFACNPPYSDDPWWDNETGLLDICSKKDLRLWNGSISIAKDPMSTSARYRYLFYKFASIVGDLGLPRCLAFDNGEKHNSFAWALGRFDKQNDTVIAEEVGEVAPGEHERIHHGLMWEHVIEPLVQRFRFLHVVWDRWESTRYVADLRTKYRIRAEQYSPTMKDGKQLRSDIANAKLILPMPECPVSSLPIEDPAALARTPRAHLLLQILTSRNGNGLPLKPPGGNDDILRATLLLDRTIRDNVEDYSRYHYYGGGRCVGIGVGGAVAGGAGRGVGLVVGHGGRALGVGVRR